MQYVTDVQYEKGYCLIVTFGDGSRRRVDLAAHLEGEIFEPLREISLFRTASLNADIDTVMWEKGADMSPDFLYEIGEPVEGVSLPRKVAEAGAPYGKEAR